MAVGHGNEMIIEQRGMRTGKNISYTFPAQNREKPRASGWLHAAEAAWWWKGAGRPGAPCQSCWVHSPALCLTCSACGSLREGLSLSLVLCLPRAQSGALRGDLLQSQRAALSTKVIISSLESHLLCFTSCPSKSPWDPRADTHTERQLLSRWSDSDSDSDRPVLGTAGTGGGVTGVGWVVLYSR